MADRVRASDAEREEYALILRAAMTEGRLTLAEGEERLTLTYAAKYRDELPRLAADLPDGGRRALEETPEARDVRRRDDRRHLTRHTARVAAIGAVLVGIWAVSGAHFFWPAIPLTFLAVGLARHAGHRRWARDHRHRGHGVGPGATAGSGPGCGRGFEPGR